MRNKRDSVIDDIIGEHGYNVKRCPMARRSNGKFRKCITSDCQWWQWKAKNCALPLICYNIGVLQMNISKSLRGN